MPTTLNKYLIEELATQEIPNEVIIEATKQIQIAILEAKDRVVISFPLGNKFDIIDGKIIIYNK